MADPLVIHDDLEMFLVGWYRVALAARPEAVCRAVEVTNHEPDDEAPFPARLLVIRDDGGADTSILTGLRSVGLSVLAGSKTNPSDAVQLALIVHALRNQIAAPDSAAVAPRNPVAAVVESAGPFPVAEAQDRSRRYITLTLAVVGRALQTYP